MLIHNNTLIAECSSYDFKEMLERKKVKSWLKSVSAFANTDGGSLFYGVNDDGMIVGLENPQADADFISEMIKARLDPVPEVQLIPIEHEGRTLLEVRVKAGTLTPYYYYQDGTRTAYTRVGNESVECNSQQLLSLVLKGTHMTWDSLPTQVDANKHSFVILANTFREQTHQEWNDKYLESFGLVTSDGKLTNAGLLFVDNCTVFQSRIFCTRWTGLYKDDAISSVEHRANLVLLLKYGMDFIKNYTMSGWVKMPNYRLNLPDYSDRAIFEGLVNHLIHRDYTVMGGEVHIDIYDDRVELVSPVPCSMVHRFKTETYTKCRPCAATPSLRMCSHSWIIWKNVVPAYAKCESLQRSYPIFCKVKSRNIKRKRLLSTPHSII
ncbi:MAG: hypothetical protein BACD_02224 [Bacteroides rodentium]